MKRKNKLIIGVTGGIAAGKSTATKFFVSKGYPVVDADKMGHKIIENDKIKNKIVENFGRKVLTNNKINRRELGRIVFANTNKLEKLNSIIHPKLINRIMQRVWKLNCEIVFIDAALLLDWSMNELCDKVILIKSAEENKLKRLKYFRNISFTKAKNIMNSQKFDESKADYIITNDKSPKILYEKLDNVLKEINLELHKR